MSTGNDFQRNHYFAGKIMTAEDFSTEQDYFLGKLRRHNRYLHGWGVVRGFEVSLRGDKIVVTPGVAVDCAGNEIILEAREMLELPPDQRQFYLAVAYTETLAYPVPTLITGVASPEERVEYGLVQEGCCVEIMGQDPAAEHDGFGPGTPGCGQAHPVPLARGVRRFRGWKISLCSRR